MSERAIETSAEYLARIGKAMETASAEERQQVRELIDISVFRLFSQKPSANTSLPAAPVEEATTPENERDSYHYRQYMEAVRRAGDMADQVRDLRAENERLRAESGAAFSFAAHLQRQRDWSANTFGPSKRTKGVVEHIRKELLEIESNPDDLSEWIDVVILALDGAWRHGASPQQIIDTLVAKQTKNEGRNWPDWRAASEDSAIEHVRGGCPKCGSPDPARHPAVQYEGEVQVCDDPFHSPLSASNSTKGR